MRLLRNFTRLRARMFVALLIFALIAESSVALAVLRLNYLRAVHQADQSLVVGTRVMRQFMVERDRQLSLMVDILTSSPDFKSAISLGEQRTLHSALQHFNERVHADVSVLLSPEGRLRDSVGGGRLLQGPSGTLDPLIDDARRAGSSSGLVMIHNRPAQFVIVPIRDNHLLAWAGMGFAIDGELARTLHMLTGLRVTFIASHHGRPVFRVSSDEQDTAPNEDIPHVTLRRTLLDAGDRRLDVRLSLPNGEVLTGYYALARRLIFIFIATLAASGLLAFWLSRRLSAPLDQLSRFARTVADGEYSNPPPSRGIGELDQLATALTEMRDAVREREARVRHQASHDALTGLPNRGLAREHLDRMLREGQSFVAVRLAVRGFQRINSALGYQLGDRALQTVSERLREATDDDSFVARTEGNDFLIACPNIETESGLHERWQRVRETLEQPMPLAGTTLQLEFAIGALFSPADADDVETVWRRSTIALGQAVEHRGTLVFYHPGMDEQQNRELTIIRDLARAVARDELSLVYQPKLNLATGRIAHVEALVRWQHPTLGFVPPDEFIGLAERSGQIDTITGWVCEAAASQLSAWQAAGIDLGMALNLSADEIANDDLPRMIKPVLRTARTPSAITLEVTESAILREPAAARANLAHLQRYGARIAVDDFGTGYSSFSQLGQLSADELKIDKSLVQTLESATANQHIVNAIISLGHRLGLSVVAEGVENAQTLQFLAAHDVDAIQGFFLARPMTPQDLTEWLAQPIPAAVREAITTAARPEL
ncbi:bifunctional diguanylate cyclase/phosphodiesterase [Salinisphaera sp. Q1T1-3]|uniref:putative bifunctional diguanylate cyclase/phosphodiesterase n=1 Tax=Salinisphaera sp. Q1T1-3 TaxID=2321229 RepID=UPI000E707DD8|nr:EAL domain-containing protein [Salinisphaera sp. Q1T1-3]RJS91273.1 sensor domain-containing phosphodiesterase [Salinisphaera sp. Q1T1-3]